METNEKTSSAPTFASITTAPEFGDAKTIRTMFGLCRSHAYQLAAEGLIRSVCLRRRGALRGKRLFDCASIRAFLERHVDPPRTRQPFTNDPIGTSSSTPEPTP